MLKTEFLKNKKCKICGVYFDKESDNSNYRLFCNHIVDAHNVNNEDYYLKYYLNNEHPKCACGCGENTNFHKGKFFKYYSDHKNHVKPSEDTLFKISKIKERYNNISNLTDRVNISIDEIKDSYSSFTNLEKPISLLAKELFIDYRTLKSYWLKLGLIENLEVFARTTKKSKTKWMVNPIKPNDKILLILKENLILVKKELINKDKLTFNDIISIIGVEINKNYLSHFLKENLSPSEIKKVKFIKSSQIEIEFLNVLKFYFGNVVKHSFVVDDRCFDYRLGKKILIELDGEFWHEKEEVKLNDKLKNEIAKKNGYILIRISDKHVKKIEFLNKLKEIYYESNKI
jgi:very-short-patch-repair endonuclease